MPHGLIPTERDTGNTGCRGGGAGECRTKGKEKQRTEEGSAYNKHVARRLWRLNLVLAAEIQPSAGYGFSRWDMRTVSPNPRAVLHTHQLWSGPHLHVHISEVTS